MENFWINCLGAILGTGVGGTIIFLASQKFIENTTNPKFDKIDKRFKEIEDNKVSAKTFEDFKNEESKRFSEFKEDYVPLKVYETSQKFLNESLREIKDMIRYLTEKFDRERKD